ncbi:uncharacterized protein [Clytia hemisphaerica]|uniref:Uncharacterized protein n=1 Tax=Clytia hemisphaerica TaxID=252671 RepID=A0A7M5WX67_9CNID
MHDKDLILQKYEDAQLHCFKTNDLVIEEQIKLPGHSWNISAVQFNSSGLHLASAGWDKTILVWDLKTLEDPKVLENGHRETITCLSWFPQVDSMMVSGSSDHSLVIWNVDNNEAMAKLVEHESWVLSISFDSVGKQMASSSWKGDVIIWDMMTINPFVQLKGHAEGVWCCAFNECNPNLLCSASEDTSLRLWDLRNDNQWHSDVILSGLHTDGIRCCSWSPCGNYIAAGSRDSKVSIWDIRSNKAINCLYGHSNIVMGTSYLSSSLLFTVGDTRCCLWNTFDPQGKPICSLQQHTWSYEVECLALSPDRTLLATGSVDKQITLSTVEVSDEFSHGLHDDSNELPYAKLPAKTATSMQEVKNDKSSADYLDDAVYLNVAREKEDGLRVAKQTIRIKAPVTSEILQNKLSNLKVVDNNGTEHQRTNAANLFRRLSMRAEGDSKENPKSKELVEERKKNGPRVKPSTASVKRRKPANSKTLDNGFLLELEGKFTVSPPSSSHLGYDDNLSCHSNSDVSSFYSNDDEYCDIEVVTSEMIRLATEEEAHKM